GGEVARWAGFIGMRVSAVSRHPSEERRVAAGLEALGGFDSLARLAADADFVVVAIPQSTETVGLIGEPVLSAMRPSAYLVNVGRGPVVDQWALYQALHDGRLAGAALDV